MTEREQIKKALSGLRASGDTLTEVMNMANETKTRRQFGKRAIVIAAAVVLALALAVAAYATGGFGLLRRAAEPGEKFRISIEGAPQDSYWKDAKLVLEFDAPEECSEIHFKPGWLPADYLDGINFADDEGWYTRLTGETQETGYGTQPYLIETYYAPMFANGGHLILLTQEPGEITDETWGDYQIMKFDASVTVPALSIPDIGWESPEHTYTRSYYLMYHQTEGYLLVLSGEATDVDTLARIGQTLTIEHTEKVVSAADYTDFNLFLDGGKG